MVFKKEGVGKECVFKRRVFFSAEANMILDEFLTKTTPHPQFNYANSWFKLDEYLLGIKTGEKYLLMF